ncbi:hypothetical protein DL767_001125 [Monosporascus sp. MG133]|nr:hypothetical protein DL767_001125 [Monosporascus sp. MG133]
MHSAHLKPYGQGMANAEHRQNTLQSPARGQSRGLATRLLVGLLAGALLVGSFFDAESWQDLGSCDDVGSKHGARSKLEWSDIELSRTLRWHSCYEGEYECARLDVPIDWLEPSDHEKVTLAVMRLKATDTSDYKGPVFFNPGGPGGSGIFAMQDRGVLLQTITGKNHDLVAFDPRGDVGVVNAHPGTVNDVFARATAFSQMCERNMNASGLLPHLSTASHARDMLEILQQMGEDKLKYWGFSYGTILGGVFASMYPDKVERLVSDGNVDYREWHWDTHINFLRDTDRVMDAFYEYCHLAGPEDCAFYAESPGAIEQRLSSLLEEIRKYPVIVPASESGPGMPQLVTWSNVKRLISSALYQPIHMFKRFARVLKALEEGDGVPFYELAGTDQSTPPICSIEAVPPNVPKMEPANDDAFPAIMCADRPRALSESVEEFEEFTKRLTEISSAAGDVNALFRLACVGRTVRPKWRYGGPFEGNTSHPILYVANMADNISPLISARNNSQGFPGSVVLVQNSYGHTTLSAPSACTAGYINAYFQNGTLPAPGTICEPDYYPFQELKPARRDELAAASDSLSKSNWGVQQCDKLGAYAIVLVEGMAGLHADGGRPTQPGIRRNVHGHRDKLQVTAPGSNSKLDSGTYSEADHEHAVISTFDLFSIGIGPSSSHTVGPMRAGNIFVTDMIEAGLLQNVCKMRISIYGSLALTGEGHMTPSALLLGLEGADVETVDTAYVPARFAEIKQQKKLFLGRGSGDGKGKEIDFDYDRDFVWEWGKKLPLHSNGMRFRAFDKDGDQLATNDLFSVGGGFVVNGAMSIASSAGQAVEDVPSAGNETHGEGSGRHPADLAENLFYKEIRRSDAAGDRKTGSEIKRLDYATDERAALPATDPDGPNALSPVTSASPDTKTVEAEGSTRQPRYPFRDAKSLLALCHKHNLTIAQIVYENEKSHGYTDDEICEKLVRIWGVMDNSILQGVQAQKDVTLPGSLKLHRRAPALYRKLTRGLYPSHTQGVGSRSSQSQLSSPSNSNEKQSPADTTATESTKSESTALGRRETTSRRGPPRIHGSIYHPILPSPPRRTTFPAMDYLAVYAIAVNETNASGGRIVTAPTNGAAGIIPSVLKYTVEFISDDPERDILTFLLTASAIGMLYKRGATISAAEGGCMAEVGVACSMAAGAFAACMGATPETVEQAAEIGIEHNLGLTCDPIGGLVQAPCIERNALGAIKAISSANLALSGTPGTQKVSLDDAIRAMRLTAQGMRNEFKETSLSGLATSVPLHIPVSVPDC